MNTNLQVELVALAVRTLANKTDLIRKPDSLEALINQVLGVKSYDRRLAEDVILESKRAIKAIKRANNKRKFKLIINQNY